MDLDNEINADEMEETIQNTLINKFVGKVNLDSDR